MQGLFVRSILHIRACATGLIWAVLLLLGSVLVLTEGVFASTSTELLTELLDEPPLDKRASTADLQSVVISDDWDGFHSFPMGYFVDTSQDLSFKKVQQQEFIPSSNKLSLGTGAKTTWSKILLKNTSAQKKRLFLHHPYAYHNRLITLYEVEQGSLIREQVLDLDLAKDSPLMYRGSAIFELELDIGQSKTLYVKGVSFSHQWFTLLLLDENSSRRELIGTHNDIALMIGILLALIIYNFLIYFSSSKNENVFYSLYLISGGIWIALSYGLLANFFNIYGANILPLHLSLITMPIFLILFMMDIFETAKHYRTEHRFLQGILLFLALDFCYGLFDIVGALEPASSLAALMMLVTISVSISLVRKGHPFAKYFLLGHSLFAVFSAVAVLFYKGLVEFNYITSHGVGIGIMLEALMLAFIISYRIRILEEIKSSQDELKLLAVTDSMTQLYNRRYFYTEANYQLKQAQKEATPLSLMILDIDRFKLVNDTHGHQTGDQVIIALANILRTHSQEGHLVARFGGEEFVILLPKTPLLQAMDIAEQIRQTAEKHKVVLSYSDKPDSDKPDLYFTVSIGVIEINTGSETIETALNLADIALYEAKNSGRNRVRMAPARLDFQKEDPLA